MRDDAIAPVIAVMLILAALVTLLSIWNAIYVPSMKESAEVEHLQNVETAFVHFSSDIDQAVSSHQDSLVFSEPVPLGGGDTLVNQLKSSGALSVQNESEPIYTLTLSGGGTQTTINGTIVNVSYEPVSNFWQDQGYTWQYGYINVTKNNGELSTPLNYYNMTDVQNEITSPGSLQTLAQSFVAVSATANTTPLLTTNGYSVQNGNCTSIDILAVNVSASPQHNFVSSNGFGTLKLTSSVNTASYPDITDVSLGSANVVFGNVTLGSWNQSFENIYAICPNNIGEGNPTDGNTIQWNVIHGVSPVTVTLHQVNIVVSAS
jgi:hypothetical protein